MAKMPEVEDLLPCRSKVGAPEGLKGPLHRHARKSQWPTPNMVAERNMRVVARVENNLSEATVGIVGVTCLGITGGSW